MRAARLVQSMVAAGGIALLAIVGGRMWFAARVPDDARPAIERFLASMESGGAVDLPTACVSPAAIAPVLASMRDVLGPRRDTGDATLAASHDGGARLDVEVPVTCENGAVVLALEVVRPPGGAWSVSDCAARSAAFEWRFR